MEAFMKIHVIPCYVSSHMVPASVPLGWPSLKYLLSGPLQRRFALLALEGGKSELSASVGVLGGQLEKAIRTWGGQILCPQAVEDGVARGGEQDGSGEDIVTFPRTLHGDQHLCSTHHLPGAFHRPPGRQWECRSYTAFL